MTNTYFDSKSIITSIPFHKFEQLESMCHQYETGINETISLLIDTYLRYPNIVEIIDLYRKRQLSKAHSLRNKEREARLEARQMKNMELRRKLMPNTVVGYTCPHCRERERIFRSIQTLRSHIRKKHASDGIAYYCPICNSPLASLDSLLKHLKMRAEEGNEGYKALLHVTLSNTIYKCHLCNQRFERQEEIRSHYESHASDFDFRCSLCEDLVQSNLQAIVNHLMEKHQEILKIDQIKEIVKTRYLCELCGFETDNAIPMFKHKIESHNK